MAVPSLPTHRIVDSEMLLGFIAPARYGEDISVAAADFEPDGYLITNIYCDGAGDVKVTLDNDEALTLTVAATSWVFPSCGVFVKKVWKVGTTATGLSVVGHRI